MPLQLQTSRAGGLLVGHVQLDYCQSALLSVLVALSSCTSKHLRGDEHAHLCCWGLTPDEHVDSKAASAASGSGCFNPLCGRPCVQLPAAPGVYLMSPMLHSLTRNISEDSVIAMIVGLCITHLFLYDYK